MPALVVALVVQTVRDPSVEWIVAALAAGGFFLIAALIYPAGLGMGDVKLAAFLGAWLGAPVIVALFAGSLLAVIPAHRHPRDPGRSARKVGIPFAPFLAGGAVSRCSGATRSWTPGLGRPVAVVALALGLLAAGLRWRGRGRDHGRRTVRRRGVPRAGRGAVRDEDRRLERESAAAGERRDPAARPAAGRGERSATTSPRTLPAPRSAVGIAATEQAALDELDAAIAALDGKGDAAPHLAQGARLAAVSAERV